MTLKAIIAFILSFCMAILLGLGIAYCANVEYFRVRCDLSVPTPLPAALNQTFKLTDIPGIETMSRAEVIRYMLRYIKGIAQPVTGATPHYRLTFDLAIPKPLPQALTRPFDVADFPGILSQTRLQVIKRLFGDLKTFAQNIPRPDGQGENTITVTEANLASAPSTRPVVLKTHTCNHGLRLPCSTEVNW